MDNDEDNPTGSLHLCAHPSMAASLLPSGLDSRYREFMDQVPHPLDWWADGGYAEVMRQTGWALPRARREVRKAIKRQGWNPIGHAGYEELRRRIMDGRMTDRDLI